MSRIDEYEQRRGPVRRRGIPTTLKSRRYRSRLEAKWAAFFDLLGWKAEYEPLDCDGWIPDFAITTLTGFTLIEVKPVTLPTPDVYEKIDAANNGGYEVVVVGLSPFQTRAGGIDSCLGWISTRPNTCWRECLLHLVPMGDRSDPIGFGPAGEACRITGEPDMLCVAELSDIEVRWAEACNRVQWRGAA